MLTLHHCAKRITPGSLEFVMDLFRELGCRESYRETGARWAMIEQEGGAMIVQLIETDQAPQRMEDKRNSHVAFLSDDPVSAIARIREWIEQRGKQCELGSWSDREHHFDCPDVFVDFVVEIMHRSIVGN